MAQEWERRHETWAIRKGFLQGVAANFRDALDEKLVLPTQEHHTVYHNTIPIQILQHLDTRWCPLNVHAKKNLCLAYYTEWGSALMTIRFASALWNHHLRRRQAPILPQAYPKQMYSSNHFDKKEMTVWENKSITIKDDFVEAKLYFEGLVKDYEVYAKNSGDIAGKHNFESANQAAKADARDKQRKYISGITQATVTQEEQITNI